MQIPESEFNLGLTDSVNSVGILFSGGVESTLLLLLLQIESLKKNFSITTFNIKNKNLYEKNCKKILSDPFFTDVKFVSEVPNDNDFTGKIRFGIWWVLQQSDLDLVYLGINKNPDMDFSGKPVRRTAAELAPYKRLRYPFLNLTKDTIVKYFNYIQVEYNLDLLKHTHSCTAQTRGQCGKCFQCLERNWAFEKNNLLDPFLLKSDVE